jgi:transcriptional regulator
MYVPAHFQAADRAKIEAIMRDHSFATIVTLDSGSPFASHVPILFFPHRGANGVLAGHVARANPQWRHLATNQEVLVIFQGPHGYVSPNWYQTKPAVPTWNYVAVHAYGVPRLLESDQEMEALLAATVEKYESGQADPWRGDLPADFKARMLKGIVGFEITVTRLEGKFKLGQNRSAQDIAGVIAALARSERQTERELAVLMSGSNLSAESSAAKHEGPDRKS